MKTDPFSVTDYQQLSLMLEQCVKLSET